MRPELQRLVDELTEVRQVIAVAGDTKRTATNGWTVDGVLDHLARVHEAMIPRFDSVLATAPDRVDEDAVRYSFVERQMLKAMGGNSKIKIPVPSMFEPEESAPQTKERCLASIDALFETFYRADGKALAGLIVASPLNDRLRLRLLPYLDSIVAHARYHSKQI